MLTQIPLLALPFTLFFTRSLAQDASTSGPAATETSSSSVPTSTADASTYDIDVGADGALLFSPESLTASVGDTINFHFYPRNHSVVQSSFDAPCVPLSSASSGNSDVIYSGFFPVQDDVSEQMFSMLVNTTDPIWLYCSQGTHCQGGMAMVVNPPTGGENTLEAYKEAASGVQAAESPSTGVAGGIVTANEEGEDQGEGEESGSSSSNSTASSTMTGSMTGYSTGSVTGSATAGSTSASATGAAAGLVRPVAGAVVVGMLILGFGAWAIML
ncbi:hypothetical protein EPUS_01432 [Endocarpon pusillum Z07020]|uniref:Phytocyanin domain-containing protein n=1 Tax=Endocarpon pusillum (strain Z07020 / HMAS-L-300199) TaxID=1263415 RepID=U1I2B4_ENDPU|nr:uncharacterized protein EPUS_01432 [Endocarpon pusillum Z07020]ERF76099.1 hypothetical protein EPUS_01432 [Endocarpon pusillum Z07020]